ncbi:MAG: DUF5615 family PIN-like protein [Chloroflexi bacterium]|nr:DUF5615 family PIN-like protein [Chloroflexota bacterium]
MRILADLHISPLTVRYLLSLGHDAVRSSSLLPSNASDDAIVAAAIQHDRVILTQDMDFSAIIARSGQGKPSLLLLRLSSSRVEHVNTVLERFLPELEHAIPSGVIVTIEDNRVRTRTLPV